MQFPESWLREFCNPPIDSVELAQTLTMAGLEVEELRPVAPAFDKVVVAEVLAVAKHPQADRLQVCEVDVGEARPLSIVCGAPNVRAGIKVPCARVGAVLPPAEAGGEPLHIRLGKLRGVESQGMLCSARELKLSTDHEGLLVLADDAPVGQSLRRHLQLDDQLITLKLTPNLGHALSVFGVARELAAITGAPLVVPDIAPSAPRLDDKLPVKIEAIDLCGRFSGRVIRGVDPKARTPAWMVERLARCGQRSVSALVDISNYVMFEYGQPSHIFDLDKIDGGLVVRWGRPGESLELLNGSTVALDGDVGVIADDRRVESLAGIMGGQATAVSDHTRNVYVEAAFWWPESVAGRSRRYAFSTDAGHRFERGVDPAGTTLRIEHITALIQQICGGEAGPIDDQSPAVPAREPVTLRVARAARVIGMPVTQADCAGVFRRLGFAFTETETETDGTITVTPPSWRFDLRIEEDLIEEVIRVIGYSRLPDTPPRAPITPRAHPEALRSVHALRHAMSALDYQETIGFSFVDERWECELAGCERPIRLLNPIAEHLSVMRTSLFGTLIEALRFNLARRAQRVRLFEVGRVYLRDGSAADGPLGVAGIRQPRRIAGLCYGPASPMQWGSAPRMVDFFDAKGDVETLAGRHELRFDKAAHPALHPGRSARIDLDGTAIGWIGELHPRWRQAYELPQAPMLFELDVEALQQGRLARFAPLPKQQAVERDIAVIVGPSVTHDAVIEAARAAATGGIVRDVRVFDVYRPKSTAAADAAAGERSIALRLDLLDESQTLTDDRIDATVRAVLQSLADRLGARLRD